MSEVAEHKGRYLAALQNGRGLAALVVVLFHAYGFVELVFGPIYGRKLFQAGHSGVEFFFVLSGFIIYLVHSGDLGRPEKLKSFVVKRVTRIYPMLWVVVVPLGLWLLVNPRPDLPLGVSDVLKDVMLIPRDGSLVLDPAWSLQHEMIFYAIFCLAILSRRFGLQVLILWQAACVVALAAFGPQDHMTAFSKLFGYYNFGFAFGILAAILYRSPNFATYARQLRLAGIIAVVLLIGMFAGEWHSGVNWLGGGAVTTIIYFTLYTTIILGSLSAKRRFTLVDTVLGALGNASYTLYLTHLPVAGVAVKVLAFAGLATLMSPTVLYLVIVATCVAAGLVLHHLIESPLLVYLKRKLDGPRGRTASSTEPASATR